MISLIILSNIIGVICFTLNGMNTKFIYMIVHKTCMIKLQISRKQTNYSSCEIMWPKVIYGSNELFYLWGKINEWRSENDGSSISFNLEIRSSSWELISRICGFHSKLFTLIQTTSTLFRIFNLSCFPHIRTRSYIGHFKVVQPWKIRPQAKIHNFAFKNSNIIFKGIILKKKDYFSWKQFETQKNNFIL